MTNESVIKQTFPYMVPNEIAAMMGRIYQAKLDAMFEEITKSMSPKNGKIKKGEVGGEYEDKEDNPNYDPGQEMSDELSSEQDKEAEESEKEDNEEDDDTEGG